MSVDGPFDCPCFVGDYASGGAYESDGWDLAPDSRAGLQLDSYFNDDWSFTGQVVGHGGDDMDPEISLLSVHWQISDEWRVNAGRQRLPMFYYSDVYDIGYAYPWVRVPTDVYGWPINNYNGASVGYQSDLGDGTFKANVFAGEERDKEDRMNQEIYYFVDKYVTHWEDMAGLSLGYFWDGIDVRLSRVANKVYSYYEDSSFSGKAITNDHVKQNFTGFAVNYDKDNVVLFFETTTFDQKEYGYTNWAKLFSAGYRFGKVTPSLMYSRYDDRDPAWGRTFYRTRSLVFRWDAMKNTAVKLQFDSVSNETGWLDPTVTYDGFVGKSKAVAVGVDYVYR